MSVHRPSPEAVRERGISIRWYLTALFLVPLLGLLSFAAYQAKGQLERAGRAGQVALVTHRAERIAQAFGCASCDGTYLAFGPDTNLPRLLAWMNELHTIPTLFGDEA